MEQLDSLGSVETMGVWVGYGDNDGPRRNPTPAEFPMNDRALKRRR